MAKTFKALSLLLGYPTAELQAAAPELGAVIAREGLVAAAERYDLAALCADIAGGDLMDLQERYVFLFDRTRSLSLHLFEHVHGESRDRGQAMVDLMAMYEARGLHISARELPDYLPLFLEFLATVPFDEAQELLGQTLHIATALKERLRKRGSVYACVFAGLERIAGAKPDPAVLTELMRQPDDDPNDLEALDAIWEEEAVTFGNNAGAGDCGLDRIRTQLRASQRRVPDPAARPDA